ncbi:MAG: hypothetical protein CVU05_02525 [Bacteroidetes bacterium HGW-Bacteroidetes-21]|jgi:hypothetical protein|nr:MAG: hypothetical protein CVU05_02525 [Bacteroidetes bacterium HGW-Bacteroidetes-21]
MAISQILTKLFQFGIDKKYFVILEVGKLDKNCYKKSKVEVIDFDRTKELIVREYQLDTIKSCDALKIIIDRECIDFIEMKSSIEILKNPKITNTKKLQLQVDKFDFIGKIRDSLSILSLIVNKANNNLNGREKQEYYSIPKNYTILTDIKIDNNPLEYLTFSLVYLGQMSTSLTDMLVKSVSKIPTDKYHNLQQPKLMDCKTFEDYYS